ncbi:MAG: BamA/TamA family outer membrane protein [Bacteroidales bacterium]|nr:BamA/TamA family outer membrane protein [Bacteroidales bacterium]
MRLHTLTFILFSLVIIPSLQAQISLGEINVTDYNNPKDYYVGGITVSGVKYLDGNVLIMLSGLTVGDKIKIPNGDKISQAIRKLWEQGLFEDIRISVTKVIDNQVFLDLYLQERPRLSKFQFNGIKKSDADDIRQKIRLVKGDYITDNLIIKTKNIIRKFYNDKGYLNAEVNVVLKKDTTSTNEMTMYINIDKNEKVKVYTINIHGNKEIGADVIKAAFKKTKEKSIFNPMNGMDKTVVETVKTTANMDLVEIVNVVGKQATDNIRLRIFKSSKFIDEDYQEDKLLMIRKYNSLGYRDARIIRDSISKNSDNTINIDIWMEEGPKYFVRNITWVGNTKYTSGFLDRILKITKGDVYDQEALEQALTYNPNGTDIRSLYMDDGYLFFDVVPVETRVENDSIDLEIRMKEGKQAILNKVTIKGNTKTNDHVALREIQTRPGQLFSRDRLIRSQRQLAQLKYFDAEKLTPNVNPNPEDGTVDVGYDVTETSADQIELSGGWGYGRIVGTVGLSFNNFSLRNVLNPKAWRPIPSGDGQKLSLRFQTYGTGYFSYSFSFTEPWLGGRKPLALSLSYFHSRYTNGLASNDVGFASFKIDGISIGLGQQLRWPDDYFSLYQSLNYNRYHTNNYSSIFTFGGGNGVYNSFSYGIILSRNSVDAPIFARNGSEISINLELTPPYSLFRGNVDYDAMDASERYKWVEYYKIKFKGSWYINMIEKLVLSPRIQFGYLGAYNSSLGVTPFERFYLGGDGLTGYNNMDGRELIGMRGYSNNSLTPGYPSSVGGSVYTKYTLELRYPVSLNPSATIFGLAFVEAGNDWLVWKNFNPFNVYRSAGVGVRVYLPMFGLLGLDWGYGIDAVPGSPGANGGQFHFSINSSID